MLAGELYDQAVIGFGRVFSSRVRIHDSEKIVCAC